MCSGWTRRPGSAAHPRPRPTANDPQPTSIARARRRRVGDRAQLLSYREAQGSQHGAALTVHLAIRTAIRAVRATAAAWRSSTERCTLTGCAPRLRAVWSLDRRRQSQRQLAARVYKHAISQGKSYLRDHAGGLDTRVAAAAGPGSRQAMTFKPHLTLVGGDRSTGSTGAGRSGDRRDRWHRLRLPADPITAQERVIDALTSASDSSDVPRRVSWKRECRRHHRTIAEVLLAETHHSVPGRES